MPHKRDHAQDSEVQVEIVRKIDLSNLTWPSSSQASRGLCGNKEYVDFRGYSWAHANRVVTLEEEFIDQIENCNDPLTIYERIVHELYDEDEGLLGLDLGVAGVVLALSAAGCVPFTSCNGGVYGGHHHEHYPLVGFYARRKIVTTLLQAATETDIGLTSDGVVFAYSDNVISMVRFARSLLRNC